MRRTVATSLILLVAGALGCGSTREAFRPTERAQAESQTGYSAAIYDVTTAQGRLGEAKLFSRGAYEGTVDGRTVTVVHVGFEIENSSRAPIALDVSRTRLDSVMINDRILRAIPPSQVRGSAVIPAGAVGNVEVLFALPGRISPQEVDAFRVAWVARAGSSTYAQNTPFVEDEEQAYLYSTYAYTPFYDPFVSPYYYRPRIIVRQVPYHHRYR